MDIITIIFYCCAGMFSLYFLVAKVTPLTVALLFKGASIFSLVYIVVQILKATGYIN